jgi:fructose-bisphosphate aldolase class I
MHLEMKSPLLEKGAQLPFTNETGLFALYLNTGHCNRRFAPPGILQDLEVRRAKDGQLVTTPGLNNLSAGAMSVDEDIRKQESSGTPSTKFLIAAGIIRVFKGGAGPNELTALPGEKVTEGLNGLHGCLAASIPCAAANTLRI